MPANFNNNTKNNDEWLTPPWLVMALGPFDLDPCAPINRPWPTAFKHYDKNDDGLAHEWAGRVWLNPPYGRHTFQWIKRLADHGSGLALIFARTETAGFHDQIWARAHAVFFFRDRLKFHFVDGMPGDRANAPSCLISYSKADTETIRIAQRLGNIRGRLVVLD